jgi:predicted RecA/RadA family phage recombinase
MGRIAKEGKSVKVMAPENTTINQGDFALVSGWFGMAIQSVETKVAESKPVVLSIDTGVFYETSQIVTTDTMGVGAELYWDAVNKKITESAGTDNRKIGRVTLAKDANNVIWFKLLDQ